MVQIVIANNGHKIENANKSFSEQKKLFNKSQLVSQEFDTMFYSKVFIISKLFINFGTTEFQTPSRAKKGRQSSWRNRGRQRGAIRFKHKISGLHLSCYWTKMNYGIAFMYKGVLISKSFSLCLHSQKDMPNHYPKHFLSKRTVLRNHYSESG